MDHTVGTYYSNDETLGVTEHAQEGTTCLQCHTADIVTQVTELTAWVSGDYHYDDETGQILETTADGLVQSYSEKKMAVVGGNTMHSSSGTNASETAAQKAAGIEDSNELFIEDTYKGGHNVGQMDLITYMCDNSNNAIEWLAANGIVLDNLAKMGGASVTRCHRPTDGSAVGLTLIPGLHDNCISHGIEVATSARVVDMLGDESGVTGVICEAENGEQTQYNCKAVVIATAASARTANGSRSTTRTSPTSRPRTRPAPRATASRSRSSSAPASSTWSTSRRTRPSNRRRPPSWPRPSAARAPSS